MTLFGFIYDSAVALVICLAALGLGWLALHSMRIHEPRMTTIWLATTCGLGLLSVGTLLLGLAGLLYPLVFAILLTPLTLYGLVIVFRTDWWRTIRVWLQSRHQDTLFRIGADLLLLASASTVVWSLLTHALMPPHEWDEIIYHLTLPKLFIESNRIAFFPFICLSLWPMNNEMLFSIALLFGSDIAPHLVMLSMSLLIAVGIAIVARHYFDDRVGIIGAVIFLNIPLVSRLSGTGLIDVAFGLYVLAALFAFQGWQQTRQWPWLVLCGLFCGFASGSKLNGMAFPLLIGLLLLIDTLQQRPLHLRQVLYRGTLFSIMCLAVVGPWYLRSFAETGNPIWPFGYHIFGGRYWDDLGAEYQVGAQLDLLSPVLPRTPYGLLLTFSYLLRQPAVLGGFPEGLGIIVPIGSLFAVALVPRSPHLFRQCLLVGSGFYLLWFLLLPLQLRYLLPVIPLLTLATAHLVMWLYDQIQPRLIRSGLIIAIIVLIGYEVPWLSPAERDLFVDRLPVLRGQMTRDEWVDTEQPGMGPLRYANTHLPQDARVLLLPYENRTYYLDREYIWGNPVCQRIIQFEQYDDVTALAATLKQMGITHVIDNPVVIYDRLRYWQRDRELMLALRDTCGQILFEEDESVVYALNDCVSPSGSRSHSQ